MCLKSLSTPFQFQSLNNLIENYIYCDYLYVTLFKKIELYYETRDDEKNIKKINHNKSTILPKTVGR